eukprot:TRINITY_DN13903_c0_g1_i2.p1 TRINITY_DN13903_c0_g1~~TRINITY_DN13903_c0_g1_i2.p1  ORF type:complete len:1219 (+),score=141.14 TRINITY_DN13903_c0_g1_i2:78-3659(+)
MESVAEEFRSQITSGDSSGTGQSDTNPTLPASGRSQRRRSRSRLSSEGRLSGEVPEGRAEGTHDSVVSRTRTSSDRSNPRESWIEMQGSSTEEQRSSRSDVHVGQLAISVDTFSVLSSFASIIRHIQDQPEDSPLSIPPQRPQRASTCRGTTLFIIIFFLAWLTRLTILVTVFVRQGNWPFCYVCAFIEVMEIVCSCQVTCRDSDVRRWRSMGTLLRRVMACLGMFFGFGLCQIIYVKKAFFTHNRGIEVLQSKDAPTHYHLRQPSTDSKRYTPPVMLITHWSFAVMSCYSFSVVHYGEGLRDFRPGAVGGLCRAYQLTGLEAAVTGLGAFLSVVVVTFTVVSLDIASSSFISSKYATHDPRFVDEERWRRVIFRIVHFLYRLFEVVSRVSMTAIVLIWPSDDIIRWVVAGVYIAITILLRAMALNQNAPNEELPVVHVTVATMMFIANMAKYVDRPGFRRPAERVSVCSEIIRIVEVVVLLCLLVVGAYGESVRTFLPHSLANDIKVHRSCRGTIVFLVSTFVYFAIGLTPTAGARGADLHSTVTSGKIEEVREMLVVDRGGETLDTNAQTRDGKHETPLMLAAASGEVEIVQLLLSAGARLNLRDVNGFTCIHHAIKNLRYEALELLVRQRGARQVLRWDYQNTMQLLSRTLRAKRMEERKSEFEKLLTPTRPLSPHLSSARAQQATPQDPTMASVRANLCWSSQLRELFPEAQDDGVAPTNELCSVSAFMIATALGRCARCLLPRAPAAFLGSLRRVRKLGQGASGEVIEVEVDQTSTWRSSVRGLSFVSNVSGQGLSHGGSRHSDAFRSPSHMSLLAKTSGGSHSGRRSWSGSILSDSQHGVFVGGPRRYAMKLQAKAQVRSDFVASSEVVALRRAVHPFIVKIEEALQTQQFFVLILELCPGGNMNQAICSEVDAYGRYRGLALSRATRYAGQALLALVHLHEAVGMIYRDVKPENVLLSSNDSAKLADFGLAHFVGRDWHSKKRVDLSCAGTIGFMAPELCYGDFSFRESVVETDVVPSFTSAIGSDVSLSKPRSSRDEDQMSAARAGRFQESTVVAGGIGDPFKTDSYSFGVTVELMLLGEDSAEVRIQEDDVTTEGDPKPVLVPLPGDEEAHFERLKRSESTGRLSRHGLDLLIKLTTVKPSKRKRLGDKEILNHPFFLETLGCTDLSEHLLQAERQGEDDFDDV